MHAILPHMHKQIEGFILSGLSFDFDDRLILKLYGQSDAGSFLVIINQFQNYFFVESKQSISMKSLDGIWVEKVLCRNQADLKALKKKFEDQGLRTFEADIRPLERYLMDQGFYAQINIEGTSQMVDGILTFYNPKIEKGYYYPEYKIMSFDIETGKDGRLYSLAYSFRSTNFIEDKVFMLGPESSTAEVIFCSTEKKILESFQEATKRLDPDIFTGWNVIGFDFHFLEKKSKQFKSPLYLGRGNRPLDMYQNARGEWTMNLEGRVIIDGPWALKTNFFTYESFKLNDVAKDVLGVGKDIDEDEVHDKWDEIERRFREDKYALARYNVKDAQLVLDIFEKTKLIDLLLSRSLISGLLLERVGGSTASFDHFFLPPLHEYGYVAPNVADVSYLRQAKGGFVLNPKVGIHENVLVMDFKSLYPTLIETFLIDPLSRAEREVNPLKTPEDFTFSRDHHILPGKISELLGRRAKAKAEKNTNLSQAIKILMNSFYGVMGSSGCRFYQEDLPAAITGTGQWLLKTVISFLEDLGFQVLYGDTDSIFVQLKTFEGYAEEGPALVKKVNHFLFEKLQKDFVVVSKLEIQYDKFFKKLILTSTRGVGEGAKKRYAGLKLLETSDGIKEEMVLTGMEYVRSDWSALARNFQFELIRRVFYGENLESFINQTLKDLIDSKLDQSLVLSKRLTKPIEEYIKNIPPHAKAAKILFEKKGILKKRPQYVMTLRGAIPIELPHDDIDYDYYIDRQLAPIADSILSLFGQSFESFRSPQLSFFEF
ncbi:MAG: DNA polymerase II [Bacteriovorax sp.]|nr:DNA polymerase II [Bacteriovorax sp.]